MATPFEADCARKSEASLQFRDKRARLNTCQCGIIRRYHWEAKESGRCAGFRAMDLKQWAEWVGVDYEEAG